MNESSEEHLNKLYTEIVVSNKLMAESMRSLNDSHIRLCNDMTEVKGMMLGIKTTTLWLLTLTITALAIIAGAKEILGVL